MFSSFRLYHSICSAGRGEEFVSIICTVPFFTCMTLSAILVSALLWVMTMTVFPEFRQVSHKSFSIALPVL